MSQQTLGEIVTAALRESAASAKVASLQDAPIEDRTFHRVDEYLATELGQREVSSEIKQASAQTSTPSPEAPSLDDVQFGLKLAEALLQGANLLEKLALTGPLNKSTGGMPHNAGAPAGGPVQVLKQPLERATTSSPAPQASAHARAAQTNRKMVDGQPENDAGKPSNEGPVIPSGYKAGPVRTTKAQSKTAARTEAERILASKIAQHKMLVSLGQIDAANEVLKEAREFATQSGQTTSDLVVKDNLAGTRFPDNEGVRNLTKAQARDMNQREAGTFFGEPVKRDNAVAAHTMTTQGLKLSSGGDPKSKLLKRFIREEKSTSAKTATIRDASPSVPTTKAAGMGGLLANVGGRVASGAQRAIGAGMGLAARSAHPAATKAVLAGARADSALAGLTHRGKQIVGGSALGAGALGARSMLGGDR